MNIVKRILGDSGGTALATRRTPVSFPRYVDSLFEQMWKDLESGPWPFISRFPDFSHSSQWHGLPPMDVAEDDQQMTITLDLPGYKPQEVDLEVTGNVLTIRGTRQQQEQQQERRILVQERVAGTFERSLTLPEYVNAEKVQARYHEGILSIIVPKDPGKLPRKIQIAS